MNIKLLKLFLISFLLLFFGCEQEFNKVVENFSPDYQVTSVSPSDSIKFNVTDSLITITIKFNSYLNIQNVYCDIYSADSKKLNPTLVELLDNGSANNGDVTSNDGKFSVKFPLSQNYPNGIFTIKYFVLDKSNKIKQVALGTFRFNNGQNNIAPVISNDNVDPDTAVVTSTTVILASIKVFDQNGLSDIDKVYFTVYRPDGTTSNIQNIMFDDGNSFDHGDQISGDGIYSLLIQISNSNTKGTYRFEFRAKDRGGKLSNIINHSLLIQ